MEPSQLPFWAIRAMHQLSYDEEESFPIGAQIVRRNFYVDDLIPTGDSVEEVREFVVRSRNYRREAIFQSANGVQMSQQPWKESLNATRSS